jgi:UDP-glucose 4-epimerase
MSKRILVTGGSGAVGARVVSALLENGHEVISLARSKQPAGRTERLTFVQADIKSVVDTRSVLSGVDVICHLAAHIPADLNSPAEAQACFDINSLATLNLALAALQGRKRFIYASSGSLYAPSPDPCNENAKVFPALHAPYYLGSKLQAELYVENLRFKQGLNSAIFRIGSVYGEGCDKSIIARFCNSARLGKPVSVTNGGLGTADFVYAEDVARLIAAAADKDASSGIFNAGSGQSHTIKSVAEIIATTHSDLKPHIEFVENSNSPAPQFPALCMAHAGKTFAHVPTSLEDGIRKMRILQGY